jgi:fatty-acyl-CoA synthase
MCASWLHTNDRQGEIGEIQIRAPHVFAGYWNNPSATKAAFDGDWLLSGDLGRCDVDGYIYVVDRKKHMIISGGENIYPAEIEQVLGEHPAIAELAVIGYPDPKWGEGVGAVVVLRPGQSLSLEDIGAFCHGKIAGYKVPTRLTISCDPLRRTVTGKLIKSEIRMSGQE